MVEVLALVLHHDEEAILTAVTMALEAGAPTKTHILNLPHRLIDAEPVTTPPAAEGVFQLNGGDPAQLVTINVKDMSAQQLIITIFGLRAGGPSCRNGGAGTAR